MLQYTFVPKVLLSLLAGGAFYCGFINIVDELKIIDTSTKKEIEILSILNKSLVFESNDGLQSPSINTVANNEDLLKKINELKKDIEESTTMDDATIVDFENIKIS